MSREPFSDTDYALLDRFFAGETSAAENEMAYALLAHWPEVDERVQAIVRGVRGLMPDAPEAGRSWETVAGAGLAYQAGADMREKSARSALRGSGVLGKRTLPRWAWPVIAALVVPII